MKAIDRILELSWEALHKTHWLEPVPTGKYRTVRLFGIMVFHVQQYTAEGLGNVCTMTMSFGPMKMLTYVITPYWKAMPMLSLDYISAGKYRKAYAEIYDLVKDPSDSGYQAILQTLRETIDGYSDLQDFTVEPNWYAPLLNLKAYKAGTPEEEKRLGEFMAELVTVYGRTAAALPVLTPEQSAEQAAVIQTYSDRLVEEGGTSTDMFKKALGADVTHDFFNHVFFAPAEYTQE